jgi:hypothetical protein
MSLTDSVKFALRMVRRSLPQTPTGLDMDGLWMHLDMEMGDGHHRAVLLDISIHGSPHTVTASCSVIRDEATGEWYSGSCQISLSDVPSEIWSFNCELQDGTLVAIRA